MEDKLITCNYDAIISGPAIAYNIAFQAIGLDAVVTWDLHGEYIASSHIADIVSKYEAIKSSCYVNADEYQYTVCQATLIPGVHYGLVVVTLPFCQLAVSFPKKDPALWTSAMRQVGFP